MIVKDKKMVEEGRLLVNETQVKTLLLDSLVDKGSISEGLGEYGRSLLFMEFLSWKSRAYAKSRNVEGAIKSLSEIKNYLNCIYSNLLKGNPLKYSEENFRDIRNLGEIARERYEKVCNEVEMILNWREN